MKSLLQRGGYLGAVLVLCAVVVMQAAPALAASLSTARINVSSGGDQADYGSGEPSISGDGRYVAFESAATNLIANDTNDSRDIFVRDTKTDLLTRISVSSGGDQANDDSKFPSISGDGRYVAFESAATNLIASDTNERGDIFVHDMQTGITTRVNVTSAGEQLSDSSYDPSISGDGRYVAFMSYAANLVANDTNDTSDVFVHDMQTGATTLVGSGNAGAHPNDASYSPSISSDGRYVAFLSYATNLVANNANGGDDVFVYDMQTGTTSLVSVSSTGEHADNYSESPSISNDGRYVAFASPATNLVANDTNDRYDVFVHDTQTGVTTRVSVGDNGSQFGADSYTPSISGDGRYVAFVSGVADFVANDTNDIDDVFVHDTQTGTTSLVSVSNTGEQTDDYSDYPSISSNGQYVTYESDATNLVSGDTNDTSDIFLMELFEDDTREDDTGGNDGGGVDNGIPNDGDGNNDGTPVGLASGAVGAPNTGLERENTSGHYGVVVVAGVALVVLVVAALVGRSKLLK